MKILIEKEDALNIDFDTNKEYPVLLNFEFNERLGTCLVFIQNKHMYADIKLHKPVSGYPAIMYTVIKKGELNKLIALGICNTPNLDESIEPITYTK